MTLLASPDRGTAPAGSDENGVAHPAPNEIKYSEDAANYVSAMVAELRQIAAKAGFEKLVTALDNAYYEAYGAMDTKSRAVAPAPGEKTSASREPKRA